MGKHTLWAFALILMLAFRNTFAARDLHTALTPGWVWKAVWLPLHCTGYVAKCNVVLDADS